MYEVDEKVPQARWPGYRWVRITNRPVGLQRAIRLADAAKNPAVVATWMTSDTCYRNKLWTTHDGACSCHDCEVARLHADKAYWGCPA